MLRRLPPLLLGLLLLASLLAAGGPAGAALSFGLFDVVAAGDAAPASIEPDADGDGVPDATDNCPTVPNGPAQAGIPGVGNQTNTDAALNAAGATVDPDGAAGPLPPAPLPADPLGDACDPDDDNDSFTGAIMVVTGGPRSGLCPSPVSVPVFDDCIEQHLGTDPLDNCPDTNADDAWPVDLNHSGGSFTVVDGLDVATFVSHQTNQTLRSDFTGDGAVNLFDVFLIRNFGATGAGFFTKDCSPP